MITKKIIIVYIFFINVPSFCQTLEGTYTDTIGNYITFSPGNKVEYLIATNGSIWKAGYGEYKIKRKALYIKIDPKYNGGSSSTIECITNKDTLKKSHFEFIVTSKKDGSSIKGVRIAIGNDLDKNLITKDGKAETDINSMPPDSTIAIIKIGFQSALIPLNDLKGGKYIIKLAEGELDYPSFDVIVIHYKLYDNDSKLIGRYLKSDEEFVLKKN
jgi:hypothetical protein